MFKSEVSPVYSCTSRRLTNIDNCNISTSDNAVICSEHGNLYPARLSALFFVVSCSFCRILQCKDPPPHRRLPFLGAILASTLEAELVSQRHCLIAFYSMSERNVENLDRTSAAWNMRIADMRSLQHFVSKDHIVESVPYELQSLTPNRGSTAWEALK